MNLIRLSKNNIASRKIIVFKINADTTCSAFYHAEYIVIIPMNIIDQLILRNRRNFFCKYPAIGILNCFMYRNIHYLLSLFITLHSLAVFSLSASSFVTVAMRASQFSQSSPQQAINCFIISFFNGCFLELFFTFWNRFLCKIRFYQIGV